MYACARHLSGLLGPSRGAGGVPSAADPLRLSSPAPEAPRDPYSAGVLKVPYVGVAHPLPGWPRGHVTVGWAVVCGRRKSSIRPTREVPATAPGRDKDISRADGLPWGQSHPMEKHGLSRWHSCGASLCPGTSPEEWLAAAGPLCPGPVLLPLLLAPVLVAGGG